MPKRVATCVKHLEPKIKYPKERKLPEHQCMLNKERNFLYRHFVTEEMFLKETSAHYFYS
ncbi:CLUMA_CG012242, isoform A [Clunio marinus]|uniref:CLUMA_CG012242, isoform A n=1 Tax=Clunio marinus TaxID=568069 RepID=A0A1J1IFR3_9DIPT|nr:CLUMA_CG012242, isoform A [Clunio marinus]